MDPVMDDKDCLNELKRWEATYLDTLMRIMLSDSKEDKNYITHIRLYDDYIPLQVTKKINPYHIITELCWILSGSTNTHILEEQGVSKWSEKTTNEYIREHENASNFPDRRDGDAGPTYGFQLRSYGAEYVNNLTDYSQTGTDQLKMLIDTLLESHQPHKLELYNPKDEDQQSIKNRYSNIIFQREEDGILSCTVSIIECDFYNEFPSDLALFAMFMLLIANITNNKPGSIKVILDSYYVLSSDKQNIFNTYSNKNMVLSNNEISSLFNNPGGNPKFHLSIRARKDIDKITKEHITITDYNPITN